MITHHDGGWFLAHEDCWEGWWSVLACSLVAVETDFWCAHPTALRTDEGTKQYNTELPPLTLWTDVFIDMVWMKKQNSVCLIFVFTLKRYSRQNIFCTVLQFETVDLSLFPWSRLSPCFTDATDSELDPAIDDVWKVLRRNPFILCNCICNGNIRQNQLWWPPKDYDINIKKRCMY